MTASAIHFNIILVDLQQNKVNHPYQHSLYHHPLYDVNDGNANSEYIQCVKVGSRLYSFSSFTRFHCTIVRFVLIDPQKIIQRLLLWLMLFMFNEYVTQENSILGERDGNPCAVVNQLRARLLLLDLLHTKILVESNFE